MIKSRRRRRNINPQIAPITACAQTGKPSLDGVSGSSPIPP